VSTSTPLGRAASSKPPAAPVSAREAALRVVGLTKRFGSKTAVDAVTMTVPAGSVFGLVGPNGAGKTTTFSILAGYLRPSGGSVEVLGFAPTNVDALRGRLGVLPQDALLPARDHVGDFLVHMALLQDLPREKAEAAARQGLQDVEGADWWTQRCGSLSHGMAKRVALAQAFLGSPDVVLLDEPTAGLDPRVAFEVRQLVKAKKGSRTIVISSHNLHELEEICDFAAILDHGKIVAQGSMAELTAANQEIRVQVAPGTTRGTNPGQVPVSRLRDIQHVTTVDLDDDELELAVGFERKETDAETIIGKVLTVLLQNDVRIRGVTKGRGLEQRLIALK
jgi:ABC-type multidrug transport system ATPase subunit